MTITIQPNNMDKYIDPLKHAPMLQKIPYVILIAEPDWKRPSLQTTFGSTKNKCELTKILLNSVSRWIYNYNPEFMSDITHTITVNDVETHFCEFYGGDCYMENEPWSASAFIDNHWIQITPPFADIVAKLNEYRDQHMLEKRKKVKTK